MTRQIKVMIILGIVGGIEKLDAGLLARARRVRSYI